ncbi:MAG: ArnT family glycosyltransferase [Phycisphaerales bacterium]
MSGVRRWSWSNGVLGGVALLALGLVALLPGVFALPPVDRDESRFAQASWQMASGEFPGDWVVPRIQDRPRLNKPPLIYWLQALSVRIGGGGPGGAAADPSTDPSRGHIGWYRLPSVVSAILGGLITWRIGRRMFAPGVGWLAGALMLCCVMVLWDGRQARSDQLLLACTTLAMSGLWGGWRERGVHGEADGMPRLRWRCVGRWWWWALWGGLALGVMAKGPITPMVVALSAVAFGAARGEWRWMTRLGAGIGVVLVLAVGVPWVLAVADRVGFGAYAGLVFDETLGRAGAAKEGHWGPPGYHLVLLAVMFWPGSLLTAAGVVWAVRRGRAGRARVGAGSGGGWFARVFARVRGARAAEMFLLCWIVPSWVVFELVSTKLPHYTLPLYPAIALLSARAVFGASAGSMPGVRSRGTRLGVVVWQGIGLMLALGGVGVSVALALGMREAYGGVEGEMAARGMPVHAAGWIGASCTLLACVVIGAGMATRWRAGRGWLLAQGLSIVAAVGISGVVFGVALPRAPGLWASSRIGERIAGLDPSADRPVLLAGYEEDSMLLLTGGRALRVGRGGLADAMEDAPGALVVVDLTPGEAARLSDSERAGLVRAFNYSKGDWVRVWVSDDPARVRATLGAP